MRNLDPFEDLVLRYRESKTTYQRLGSLFRQAEKQEKSDRQKLVDIMRNSKIGALDGVPVLEKGKGGRESATIERVRLYAPPETHNLIIERVEWDTFKFLDPE